MSLLAHLRDTVLAGEGQAFWLSDARLSQFPRVLLLGCGAQSLVSQLARHSRPFRPAALLAQAQRPTCLA